MTWHREPHAALPMRRLLNWPNYHALVVCGTMGEAPTLSPAEHRELIRIAVAQRSNSGHRWSMQ